MLVLGLSEEHDSGVALIVDGRIVFAINEERITRNKLQGGFPSKSLERAVGFLDRNGLTRELTGISIATKVHTSYEVEHWRAKPSVSQHLVGLASELRLAPLLFGTEIGVEVTKKLANSLQGVTRPRQLRSQFKRNGLSSVPIRFYDHHFCHAVSAYFTSGFNDCLAITMDAAGDGYCSRVYLCRDGQMRLLHSIPFFHSVGYYYTMVNFILGFKDGQQGKVTSLAARGDARKAIHIFRDKIPYSSRHMRFDNRGKYYFYEMPELARQLRGCSREDVAASIQTHLEESVAQYIEDILSRFNLRDVDLVLAGGTFANVLLNMRASRVNGVNHVFVHPHMGDGGLATGAALALFKENNADARPYKLPDVYIGDALTDDQIELSLKQNGLEYQHCDGIEEIIAHLLAQGNVVARVEGRMEYGPRALGHRSIIYQATDPTVKDWLNKRLNRSEFMPFAPAVLEEYADEYFVLEGQHHAAYFMTIACDTTPKCRQECPAVVHVDGTARPQLVNRTTSPSFHRIIDEYRKLTGLPVVINTSFNMHEEPIVESAQDAIDAFTRGDLDYLAIGNFLAARVKPCSCPKSAFQSIPPD